jgi:hypothetical protein
MHHQRPRASPAGPARAFCCAVPDGALNQAVTPRFTGIRPSPEQTAAPTASYVPLERSPPPLQRPHPVNPALHPPFRPSLVQILQLRVCNVPSDSRPLLPLLHVQRVCSARKDPISIPTLDSACEPLLQHWHLLVTPCACCVLLERSPSTLGQHPAPPALTVPLHPSVARRARTFHHHPPCKALLAVPALSQLISKASRRTAV